MTGKEVHPHLSRISTNWELLFHAQRGTGEGASEAQRLLLQRYCGAVYRYLLAAVRDPDAAEELSQEFALRFVRGDFKRADPERGRFRDFLKTSLYHLIVDHHRAEKAKPQALPADNCKLPKVDAAVDRADEEFIRLWREELVDRAWDALRALEESAGQRFYAVLRWRAENPQAPAAQLAQQLHEQTGNPFTEAGIRQTLHRARIKFADLLLEEVARSLQTSERDQLEQELIDLQLLAYCQPALERYAGDG